MRECWEQQRIPESGVRRVQCEWGWGELRGECERVWEGGRASRGG